MKSLAIFFSCAPFHWLHLVICLWFQVKEAVKYALSVGYRHVDCAAAYSNEAEIGDAFQECIGPNKVKTQEPHDCMLYQNLQMWPERAECEVNVCGFSFWSVPAACY